MFLIVGVLFRCLARFFAARVGHRGLVLSGATARRRGYTNFGDTMNFEHTTAGFMTARIFALLALVALAPAMAAATLYDSTAGTPFGVSNATDSFRYSETFVVGQPGTVSGIRAYLGGAGTVNLAIHADAGGVPGASLSSGSATVSATGYVNVAMSSAALSGSTAYWYVMSAAPGDTISVYHTNLTPSTWAISSDSGASWFSLGGYKWLFAIDGTSSNTAPVAVADSFSGNEDAQISAALPGVLANDSDPENDPMTAVLVAGPANGSLVFNADGSFVFTPAVDWNGTTSFTYQATDGSLQSAVTTVVLTVAPVNDAPVANPESFTVSEDAAASFGAPGVLANDTDAEGDALTAVLLSGPVHGSLTFNANGGFDYTPNTDYFGQDGFEYATIDTAGAQVGSATVTLIIDPVADAPEAAADAYSTEEDNSFTVAAPGVLGNDSDPDGDALVASVVTGPLWGILVLNTDGSFVFTPNADFNGSDSFEYAATDPTGLAATKTVRITIVAVNDAPVFTSGGDVKVHEDDPTVTVNWASGIASGPADECGQSVYFEFTMTSSNSLFAAPPQLSATGQLTFTPATDAWGACELEVVLRDNGGTSGSGASDVSAVVKFRILIVAVNDAPSFMPGANAVVNEDCGPQTLSGWATLISAGARDAASNMAFIVTGSSNATLFASQPAIDATSGDLTFEPAADAFGFADITVLLQEIDRTAQLPSVPQTFRIVIQPVNDAPMFMAGARVTTRSNAGHVSIAAWGNAIAVGPANEYAQLWEFVTLQVDDPAMFASQPRLDADGTLRFTPATGRFGVTTVSFIMVDNGGNTNGGVSSSMMQTLTIEVLPENDQEEVSCSTGSGKGLPWMLLALLMPALIVARRTRAKA